KEGSGRRAVSPPTANTLCGTELNELEYGRRYGQTVRMTALGLGCVKTPRRLSAIEEVIRPRRF
ncbi:hypothetical protein, partial [Bradyrhizobium sp. NAS80.1]|uniref:hypothetical protein n=1 Tax=Bradyrhizobium sp. NAS80.1 TaxID=1680159 RepID=UPI001AEFB2C4